MQSSSQLLLERRTGQVSTILKTIHRLCTTKRKAITQGSTIRRIITRKEEEQAIMIRTSGEDREKRKSKEEEGEEEENNGDDGAVGEREVESS